MCLPNFSGSRCEFPQNGATLAPNLIGNSTDSSGTIVTACGSNNPCLNNSTCLLINNQPTCFCNGGLLPPFCSSSSQVSSTTGAPFGNCQNNPCQNNQPCILIQNQPVCFCAAGLLPPLCTGTTTAIPGGMVFILFLFFFYSNLNISFFLLFILFYIFKVRQQ